MPTPDEIRRLVDRLASLGPGDTLDAWLDGQADLIARQLHSAGPLAERVVLRWMATQRWRPAPADLLQVQAELSAEQAREQGIHQGPQGCTDCRGTGVLRARWVCRARADGDLVEHARALYCGCGKGGWLAEQHAQSKAPEGPVRMQHVEDFVRGIQREPLIGVDEPRRGIIWWIVETPTAEGMPDEVKAELGRQAQLKAVEVAQRGRPDHEQRVERGPHAGRVQRPPQERTDTWSPVGGAPLRPDRGWGGRAERFGVGR